MTAGARRLSLVTSAVVLITAALAGSSCSPGRASAAAADPAAARAIPVRGERTPLGADATGRDELRRIVDAETTRLATNPTDAQAAVHLAMASLRLMRVTGSATHVQRAEAALNAVLAARPRDYDARRMLAAVYTSQHRFRDAIGVAEQTRADRPGDTWNYGVLGDAHLELGEYAAAFDAFDEMARLKPNAASYARASYAHELQGDLPGALRLMKMAAEATSAHDAESLAWHAAQIGHLYLQMDRLREAAREYARAEFIFPGHPLAREGTARVKALQGDYAGALGVVQKALENLSTPADLGLAGDLLAALGRTDAAERHYQLAEAAWRSDVPEPARLARFLAERGRHLDQAVAIAEQAAKDRRDIFTMDALAWALHQTRQRDRARAVIAEALRTGTQDPTIRYHAAVINDAPNAQAVGRRWSIFRP